MRLQELIGSDAPLLNFEYVDEDNLDSYYQQLKSIAAKAGKGTKFSFSISLLFMKTSVEKALSDEDSAVGKIRYVLTRLRDSGSLIEGFPKPEYETAKHFYFSSGTATKYVIPKERLSKAGYPSEAAIWLIKGGEADERLSGSVVYLLQGSDAGKQMEGLSSLYSATHFLLDEIGLLRTADDPRNVEAYADVRSPDIMLEDIGGRRQSRREVVCCYRCRSLSDNMYFNVGGELKRFGEAVAYPLFIASL